MLAFDEQDFVPLESFEHAHFVKGICENDSMSSSDLLRVFPLTYNKAEGAQKAMESILGVQIDNVPDMGKAFCDLAERRKVLRYDYNLRLMNIGYTDVPEEFTEQWLRRILPPEDMRVIVYWQSNIAMLMDLDVFVREWVLVTSGGTVAIFPCTCDWILYCHPSDAMFFAPIQPGVKRGNGSVYEFCLTDDRRMPPLSPARAAKGYWNSEAWLGD